MLVTRGSRLPHRPHLPLTACAVTVGPTKMASYQPQERATPPGPRWARVPTMRTLHVGLRVSNLDPSLAFYRAVGYTVTGTVEGTPFRSPDHAPAAGRSLRHHRAGPQPGERQSRNRH